MTNSQKVNVIVKTYIKYCTDDVAFANGKPTASFFKLRSYFLKQEQSIIDNVYRYSINFKTNEKLSLMDFFSRANENAIKEKQDNDREQLKEVLKEEDVSNPYDIDAFLTL